MLSKKEKQLSLSIMGLLRRQNKQNKAMIAISNFIMAEHDFNLSLSKSNLALIEIMQEHTPEGRKELENQYYKWMDRQSKTFETQKKLYDIIISQFENDKATEPVGRIESYAE